MIEKSRCWWPGEDPLYISYHDQEWGVPEYDPRALYEKLVLDGFQAGLSWLTILKKREAFRRAYGGFDPEVVAAYRARDRRRLLADPGIILPDRDFGGFAEPRHAKYLLTKKHQVL